MAFVSRFGLYEFTVLPFGLCNACSTFYSLINYVLSNTLYQYVLVHIDNIIIYSKTH